MKSRTMNKMTDGTFHKVGKSETRMFGPRCLVICGYKADEQEQILSLVGACGLSGCPVMFAREEDADASLGDIVTAESGKGRGLSSGLLRVIVMSGLTERELHLLLSTYRSHKLPPQLWATLTPVSEAWTLRTLLEELAREAEAFKKRQQEKKSC